MECNQITFSRHALVQMFARKISNDDVVNTIKNGELVKKYADDEPYPSYLLLLFINKRPIHVLTAFNETDNMCIVITAYEPDVNLWESDFKTRRK